MRERTIIAGALGVLAICAGFFIFDILSSMTGWRSKPISWQAREVIEIGAVVGLVLGLVLGGLALRRSRVRHLEAEAKLRLVSIAFMEVVEEYFADWALTPAERDVALFVIKGLSTAEIATLRGTSEGTIKAQTNAIYRKAEVSGRAQLLSQFIDGLMDDRLMAQMSDTPEAVGDALGAARPDARPII